jgi:hypothetical protein
MSKWAIAASSFFLIVLAIVGVLFWKHHLDALKQRAQAQAQLDTLLKQQTRIANLESKFGTEIGVEGRLVNDAATASQARRRASLAIPLGSYQVNLGSAAADEYATMVAKAKQELNDVNAMYVNVSAMRSTLLNLAEGFANVLGDGPVKAFRATSGQYTQDIAISLNPWLRGITDISDDINYNADFTTENIEQLYDRMYDYAARARSQRDQLMYEKAELDKEVQAGINKTKNELIALGGSGTK